jgi:crossover junction endodeoxyribonuclease RuvC
MGIDPGFAITGYGIIEHKGNHFSTIEYGVITTKPSQPFSKRLLKLNEGLEFLISTYKPEVVSVEELFFNKNVKTAITAAQGRGVAILSAAKQGVKVFEYTPLQVKQAVTGYGRADKKQIQQMVKLILNLLEVPRPDDAADALAVAICHAHSKKIRDLEQQ